MTISKKKDLITKSSLSYSRMFGVNSKGPLASIQNNAIDEILSQDPLEAETIKRNRLYKALVLAKSNNDLVLIEKIERELGIIKPVVVEKVDNSKAMDGIIDVLKMKLMDPNISDEEHDKTLRTLMMISMGKDGNMAAMAFMQPTRQPVEAKKNPMDELTMTFIKSVIENKSKDEKESELDKYLKYKNLFESNTIHPMDVIKDAKDTLESIGIDISGSKGIQQMQMELEKLKITNEFAYKDKELAQKAESNKLMGGWIKELSSAVVEGIVDSVGDDEEKTESKEEKPQKTNKKSTNIKELRVKCFNCKNLTNIDDIDTTREIVCQNCLWPHYYDGETHAVKSITPDQIRKDLKMEPQEFLDQYEEGNLTKQIEGTENESG